MSEKKTILFNDSFTTNKTRKKNGGNKPKKEKPKTVIKPNTLKKSLLEKIKKHQQKEKITKTIDTNSNKENNDSEKEPLYSKIGRLEMENDFLKKSLLKLGQPLT